MAEKKLDEKKIETDVDVKIEEKTKTKEKPEKPVLDEKMEIDLRELQIKLERIKSYLIKTEGRIKNNEQMLKKLREKMTEIESKRQAAAVVTKPKLEKNI